MSNYTFTHSCRGKKVNTKLLTCSWAIVLLLLTPVISSAQARITDREIDAGNDTLSFVVPTGSVSIGIDVSGTFVGSLEVAVTSMDIGGTYKVIPLLNRTTENT